MKIIPVDVSSMPTDIVIGYKGENEVEQIAFDYSKWAEEFGEGILVLYIHRDQDSVTYPVAMTVEGHIARWTISSIDTQYTGWIEAQLKYKVGDAKKKTAICPILVNNSIDEGGTPPEPIEAWLETLTDLGAQTQQNAATAVAAAEAAAQSEAAASRSSESAGRDASNAEAYGAGTRGGEDVEASDPAYHNNAKYYAERAEESVNKGGYLDVEMREGNLYAIYTNIETVELELRNGGLYVIYG